MKKPFRFPKGIVAFLFAAGIAAILIGGGFLSSYLLNGRIEEENVVLRDKMRHQLNPRNWSPLAREWLDKLLFDCSQTHASAYAVFDWDNTSVFLDVEEATFVYMLENLSFKMTPAELAVALATGVPLDAPFKPAFCNATGKVLNARVLIGDIVRDYEWLRAQINAASPAAGTPRHAAFRAKFRFLYDALDLSFGSRVSYPWITYIFAGMTPAEVRATAAAAVRWQLAQRVETVVWTVPAECGGDAGVVSIPWSNGLRLVPEMQDLYHLLAKNRIEPWVCTASLADVVRGVACDPAFGYDLSAERVVGMELQLDANGRFLAKQPDGFVDTQAAGKTDVIKKRIAPKYLNRGPVLVAGDSNGDANMLRDFADTRISLIIDRGKPVRSAIGKLAAQARAEAAAAIDAAGAAGTAPAAGVNLRYLLQPRDERTGLFSKEPPIYNTPPQ